MEEETRYLYLHRRTYGREALEFDTALIVKETTAQYVVELTNQFGIKYQKRINKSAMIRDYEKWFPSPEVGAQWFLERCEAKVVKAQSGFDRLDERIASIREDAVEFLDRAKRERDEFKATNAALLTADA